MTMPVEYPDFIKSFPSIETPFSDDDVKCYAIKSDHGLAILFEFLNDFTLPPHSHLGQWGTVIEGSVTLTIDGETQTYLPGQSYNIPAGVVHSGEITAGTKALDVFEENDRYALRPQP